MKAVFLILVLAVVESGGLGADDNVPAVLNDAAAVESAAGDGSRIYQIPRVVYVGDSAVLVVPIDADRLGSLAAVNPPSTRKAGQAILIADWSSPRSDVTIRSVDLIMRRDSDDGAEIRIEFTAYSPGKLFLPTLAIDSLRLDGLYVDIASVLTENDRNPAPPEGTLMAPGTLPLLYGVACLVVLLGGGGTLAATRGTTWLRRWKDGRRQRHSLRSLRRLLSDLRSGIDTVDGGIFMDKMTTELRSFLTVQTGVDCRTLSPPEFSEALRSVPIPPAEFGFLPDFFKRSDVIRFGRRQPGDGELAACLGRAEDLMTAIVRGRAEGKL